MKKPEINTLQVKPTTTIKGRKEVNGEVVEGEYTLISEEHDHEIEARFNDIVDYMETTTGEGESEHTKDEIYGQAKKLWNAGADALNNAKFNLNLTREEYIYLVDLLENEFEYDANTMFYVVELIKWIDSINGRELKNDVDKEAVQITATELTLLFHIIGKHKIKGLCKEAFLYMEIIKRITEISKLYDYWNNRSKEVSEEIQRWVASFSATEDISMD